MKQMRQIVREGYDAGNYAEVFRIAKALTVFERRFLDRYLALLRSRPRIVDFGCGIGLPYDKYLVEHGAVLTGLDVSPKHLFQAMKSVPGATYIEADFSTWQPPHLFDGMMSLFAIFHIPRTEHEALLRRMVQALTANGVMLCTLAGQEVEVEEPKWCGAPMAWSCYEPAFYIASLEKLGFSIIQSEFEGAPGEEEYHFWLIAQRRTPCSF